MPVHHVHPDGGLSKFPPPVKTPRKATRKSAKKEVEPVAQQPDDTPVG
jgi:hypothetical protein